MSDKVHYRICTGLCSHTRKVITSTSSNSMSIKDDTNSVNSLAKSLLVSITDITESIVCIQIEQNNFIEIGCYLYRASAAIMELQTAEKSPANAMEILQSLSKSIDLAKDLVGNFQKTAQKTSEAELIIAQLEEVIKHIGEGLSLIPSSTYGDDEYAEVAIKSLAKEMQNAHFGIKRTQFSNPKEPEAHMPSLKEKLKEELPPLETDLYSVEVEVSMENSQLFDMPNSNATLSPTSTIRSQRKHGSMSSGSLTAFPELAQYMDPLYNSFFCPLTEKIMEDPVTIETGVTYERKAITEWFNKFERGEKIFCPTTRQKLGSRVLSTNIALKTTIEEWTDRNEVARIKVARAALSLASSEEMILEALNDLQRMCRRKQYNKVQIRHIGIIPLLIKLLEYKGRKVRCATLEMLLQLAKGDDEGKRMIVKTMEISKIVMMLSSSHQAIRHASLLILLELSQSQSLGEKVGSVAGGILMLIKIKFNQSDDAFASEKADEILMNLERSPNNIKQMAENGLLDPLLNHLIEGSEEMKMEMANYLGEIVLRHDSQTYVAQNASPSLIKMVHTGNTLTRNAAFKALQQISSHHPNGNILVEAGIIQIMVQEMFARRIYDEPMDSRKEAAAIVANILESGVVPENLQVDTHGHKMASEYIVLNIINMIQNSTPDELNINLIRSLLCLTKSLKSRSTIVSVMKETEASYTVIEFINNSHEELGIAAIKLLTTLSPFMGHTLADRLCKTNGLPEDLIRCSSETIHITEKKAVSVNFLAKLPHQNLRLNLALLNKDAVPTILQQINQIQKRGTRTSRYASAYLEGLVSILVRFTTTLYEPQMLFSARNHNFTLVFTELLMKTSSDEIQRLSAIGLENLSSVSINLSKPPHIKRTKFMKLFYLPKFQSFGSSKKRKIPVCPVHRGVCSSQNTFCLFDAKVVERLLTCLNHENVEVAEAALSAICTLLDDKVDVDKSVSMLIEVNAIDQVMNVVRENRQEGLWQKSFWVIERLLSKGGDKSASDISQDRSFHSILVSAFHHGDGNTKEMAEKILRHLNKMSNFSITNNTL